MIKADAAAATALSRIAEGEPGHEASELPAITGLAAYLITTVLLLVPLLLLTRRQSVPIGSATALLVLVATFSAAVVEFRQPLVPVVALLAGLALDAFLVRTREWTLRARTLTVSATLPAVLWPLQLTALALTDAVGWPVELWSGVVVLSVGVAVLLGALSLGSDRDRAASRPAARVGVASSAATPGPAPRLRARPGAGGPCAPG